MFEGVIAERSTEDISTYDISSVLLEKEGGYEDGRASKVRIKPCKVGGSMQPVCDQPTLEREHYYPEKKSSRFHQRHRNAFVMMHCKSFEEFSKQLCLVCFEYLCWTRAHTSYA